MATFERGKRDFLWTSLRPMIALALLLSASTAGAFVDPPTISPANAVAGQTVAVSVRAGICDGFYYGEPGYPQITRVGNAVRIVLPSAHSNDPITCNYPTAVATYAVGASNAVTFYNVVDQTRIIRELIREGWKITREDLAVLSPYVTSHIKRFGDYLIDADIVPEPYEGDLPLAA